MSVLPTAPGEGAARPRLLIAVNSDWFFLSHRLPIARAARDAGLDVVVATIDTGQAGQIRREGFRFIPLPMTHQGSNPVGELGVVGAFVRLYRSIRPDLVHHVTIKPVLYGSIAARLCGGIPTVNAVSGLGFMFGSSRRARVLRPLVNALYRAALGHPASRTIFQNPDDRAHFVSRGLVAPERTVLIRGSGVDCGVFQPASEPPETPVVMLPARLLRDKGVGEFVEAARRLRAAHPEARFALVGKPDPGNPTAVPQAQLDAWTHEGVVECWGHRGDMPGVLRQAAVVVLPSHREGLPKALLEAASCGLPIVATDVPGCREVVRSGENGFLVPLGDVGALASAIAALLADAALRRRLGRAGRELALEQFSEAHVVRAHLAVYRELLGARGPGARPG